MIPLEYKTRGIEEYQSAGDRVEIDAVVQSTVKYDANTTAMNEGNAHSITSRRIGAR